MGEPAPHRIYDILNEIRIDVGAVKTDVALTAAEQPHIIAKLREHDKRFEGHSDRLRIVERRADQQSWLPKVAIFLAAAGGSSILTYIVTTIANNL